MITVETKFSFVNVPKSAHLSLSLSLSQRFALKREILESQQFYDKRMRRERERDFNLGNQNQNPFNKMRKLWLFLLQKETKEMKEFYEIFK